MTPNQEKAARAYKRRQAWDKVMLDAAASFEKNPQHMYGFALVLAFCLAVALWPW